MAMEFFAIMGMEHQAVKGMDQHTSQQNLNVSCPFFILAITARFMRFTGDGCSDFTAKDSNSKLDNLIIVTLYPLCTEPLY